MALNVGINGFGRIGRIIFRSCLQNPSLNVSAINDPAVDIDYVCYLIKFDSTHGKFRGTVSRSGNEITIDGHKIAIFKEKLPTNIPWQIADVQYVVEASGMFTNLEKASGHLASEGVKRVLVTSPSLDVPMIVLGVNDNTLSEGNKVMSCASSTLYCLAPIIKILEDHYGVSEGFITSIHAMTPSLKPLDGLCLKGKHWRDHRGIHQNIIPATTGACRALGKIIPQVKDKMIGLAFRVPIVNVSVLDITIRLKSNTSLEDIIKNVENAGNTIMKNIIKTSNDQAVSSDFIGDTFSCILDLNSSLQLTPEFYKLICWYENEYSYACRIMDSIFFMERQYQLELTSKISYIRPTPKQSLVPQKEYYGKFTYHQACSYEYHSNPKSLCSTSQDSGFKSPKRPALLKKSDSPRNFGTRTLTNSTKKESKKNEFFKIWNDENDMVKVPLRHNRGPFLHSCVAIKPQLNTKAYVKTRERLENVKKEFSKMVIMTENLLKQSQQSKIGIGFSEILSNDTNINKVEPCEESIITLNENTHYITPKEANDICKEIKHESNFNTVIDERKRHNKNTFVSNGQMNNSDKDKIDICSVNNKKNCCSLGTINSKKINSSPALTCNEDVDDQKFDKKYNINPNSVTCNSKNTTIEKIAFADDNNVIQKSKCNFKKQIDCQIETVDTPLPTLNQESITQIDNGDYSLSKCRKQEQETSFLITSNSESSNVQTVNVNDNNASKIINNKSELEKTDNRDKQERNLQLRLEGILKKLAVDTNVVSGKPSTCLSSINTITTASNRDVKHKQDIYDKLDSVSATDSENSFHMKERKSQVINITDLSNSLEDLDRLDKICRIIEISDELSDQLLSALNNNDRIELKNKKWSFKDFCEKIKFDDFCNKMFSKSNL